MDCSGEIYSKRGMDSVEDITVSGDWTLDPMMTKLMNRTKKNFGSN